MRLNDRCKTIYGLSRQSWWFFIFDPVFLAPQFVYLLNLFLSNSLPRIKSKHERHVWKILLSHTYQSMAALLVSFPNYCCIPTYELPPWKLIFMMIMHMLFCIMLYSNVFINYSHEKLIIQQICLDVSLYEIEKESK